MPGPILPRASDDKPSRVRGKSWNTVVDEVARLGGFSFAGGARSYAAVDTGAGPAVVDVTPGEIWIKLTSGGAGGKYAWAEVARQGGAWVALARAGTTSGDYALELNGKADVPVNTVVRARRNPSSGEWVFAREC